MHDDFRQILENDARDFSENSFFFKPRAEMAPNHDNVRFTSTPTISSSI